MRLFLSSDKEVDYPHSGSIRAIYW